MIDHSLLKVLTRVDNVIGGDHGGGKFCYDNEGKLSFNEKKNSFFSNPNSKCILFKDKTIVLRATILDPIGAGLQ